MAPTLDRPRDRRITRKARRRLLCARAGVPNTGRQWRKLRKAIARAERQARTS